MQFLSLIIKKFSPLFKVSELAEGLRKKSVVATAEQPQPTKPLEQPESAARGAKDAAMATGVATVSSGYRDPIQ